MELKTPAEPTGTLASAYCDSSPNRRSGRLFVGSHGEMRSGFGVDKNLRDAQTIRRRPAERSLTGCRSGARSDDETPENGSGKLKRRGRAGRENSVTRVSGLDH